MTDIALVWNPATGHADIQLVNGDLQTDPGLETAVIISLFCDALAGPGDIIPDGSDDPRGWWGDAPLASEADQTRRYFTGSKLWLRSRELQTNATLRLIEDDARSALKWLLDDGVAGSVTVTASYPTLGTILLKIGIAQQGGSSTFSFAWPVP